MCVCVCVCVCVFIYVYMLCYLCVCVWVGAFVCGVCVCVCVCVCLCRIYICTCMYMHTYRSQYHGSGRTQAAARCAPALLVQKYYTLLLCQYKSTTNANTRCAQQAVARWCSCFTSTKVREASVLLILLYYTNSDTP